MSKKTKEDLKAIAKSSLLGGILGLGIAAGAYGFGYVIGKLDGK